MTAPPPKVAIGRRLEGRDGIITLGPRPSPADYTAREWALIRAAPVIYYPTRSLAAALRAIGQPIYPSWESIYFGQDKIRQLALFQAAGLPQPRTGIYFGRQRQGILDDFSPPFIAKTPRASALGRGVFLIESPTQLDDYLTGHNPAYIQDYLAGAIDVRVVVLGGRMLLAYIRQPAEGEFKANLAQGGRIRFDGVPDPAVELALETARKCNLDESGIDVLVKDGQPYLIEINYLFGRRALKQAGIDFKATLREMIVNGEIEARLGVG